MRVCILGRTKILLETAKLLNDNGFKITTIITSTESPSDQSTKHDFKKLAKKINADFLFTNKINEIKNQNFLKKQKIDVGISINNPLLLNKKTLFLFKKGILNAHSGDLPRYRGNACPNWAILEQESKIGLIIHFMDEELDSGDIVMKKYFEIKQNSSISDFYDFAVVEYPKMFLKCLQNMKNNKLKKIKQSQNLKILRTYPRNKNDGKINWNSTAHKIDSLIRASRFPFSGSYTYFNSKKLFVLDAKVEHPKFSFLAVHGQVVERKKTGEVLVACTDAFLVLKKIKYQNKIYDKPAKLIKTIHTRLGMDIETEIEKLLQKLNID